MGATAGSNAAPIVANIIRRSAALLGVKPDFSHESEATVVSYRVILEARRQARRSFVDELDCR